MKKIISNNILVVFLLITVVLFGFYKVSNLNAQTGLIIGAAGDISPSNNGPQFQTATLIETINPALVLPLGDNQYPDGTLATFNQYYNPSWGRFKAKSRPVPGNHDYHTTNAQGYYDYFGSLAGDPSRGYYSYNMGGWHFIALNSERMSTAQNDWLTADLQANQGAACTIAYFHHPRFSSSATHGGDAPRTAPFWERLYQYRADVILVGHNHHYERFAQINPSNQLDPNGLRQFIVGTGGAGLYPFASPFPNSQIRIGTHGVLKMTLNAGNYSWQFLNTSNQVLDSGSANCVGGGGAITSTPTLTPTGPTQTPTNTPTPMPTMTPTPTPIPTTGGGTTLSLTPPSQNRTVNQAGNLNVFVNPNGRNVASMELVINFNPSLIRVDNIVPGAFFTPPGIGSPVEIIKSINNTTGRIHYALGFPLGSNHSSTTAGNAALISFTTRNLSGTSQFSFVTSGTPSTKVSDINAMNVLSSTTNASVTVTGGPTLTPTPTSGVTMTPTATQVPTMTLTPTATSTPGGTATPTSVATLTPTSGGPTPTPGEPFVFEGCLETGGRTGRGGDDDDDDDRASNSANSGRWRNIPFPSQAGKFEAEFDAIPTSTRSSRTASLYAGLSKGAANDFTDLATAIEFGADGNIRARDGNRYRATRQLSYRLGRTYHIRMVVDVPNHTYSAYVKPPTGRERQIANNFKFRTEQRRVSSLDNLGFYARTTVRKLKICDLRVTPLTGGPGGPTVTSSPTPTLPPGVTPTATLTPTPLPTAIPTMTPTPTGIITATPTSGVPTPTLVPCTPTAGDADGDGDADQLDYNVWLANYNPNVHTDGGPSVGDFNCSGFVDGVDYSIWLAAQGTLTPTPTPSGPTPTPTPGGMHLDNAVCNPDLGSSAFTTNITNTYLPFTTGYLQNPPNERNLRDAGSGFNVRMRIIPNVAPNIKLIYGADGVDPIQPLILEEYETNNGVLIEISNNWFVQTVGGQLPGTVCYLGEYVTTYNPDGSVSGHGGSWEAGSPAQARAGIMMPPTSYLTVGRNWLIEDAACCGAFEDGRVASIGGTFNTPAGTFNNVLYIEEDIVNGVPHSNKRYAPGVGMISDEGALLINY